MAGKATHGHTVGRKQSKEYRAWSAMLDRCENRNHPDFRNYGGRGIAVCAAWRESFAAFLKDVGPAPSKSHSLDRFPNLSGNYELGNCRWATRVQQNQNTRRNRIVTFRGEDMCVSEAARRAGQSIKLVNERLAMGWTVERALLTPKRANKGHGKKHHA